MSEQPKHRLIAADRVSGTAVYGAGGDKLGHIEDLAIDKVSGKVAYAILSFGGMLGIGERYHPLPWSMLTYDTGKDGYVVPVGPNELKDAPTFEGHELSGDDDEHYRNSVFEYYSAFAPTPYRM